MSRSRRRQAGSISQAWYGAMLLALAWPVPGAAASGTAGQLAVDRGCYNCHSEPSNRSVRSFAEIRKSYASQREQPDAEKRAVERMLHGSLFSHVAAHEQLTHEEAQRLVHWLFTGEP